MVSVNIFMFGTYNKVDVCPIHRMVGDIPYMKLVKYFRCLKDEVTSGRQSYYQSVGWHGMANECELVAGIDSYFSAVSQLLEATAASCIETRHGGVPAETDKN